ncbi:50S ribosomal protein L15 [Candidatus Dependentiae bacterium]|nr:50S ribosomal protein L15 [Candidatus Dependentiae bacterium]
MLQLHELESLKKKRKRVGRGGSRGGTSGRGHKGQRSRSGGRSGLKPFFEGGQMPLSRRLPCRGFTNVFKKEYCLVGLKDLEERFDTDMIVDRQALREKGLIKSNKEPLVKILSNGIITKKLTVHADAFSKSAIEAIKKAGGQALILALTGEKKIAPEGQE